MTGIGIIGLGSMGRVHYEAYQRIAEARILAVADADPRRAAGDLAGTAGNVIPGGLTHLPMDRLRGYTDWRALIAQPDIDVVDICLPTPFHREVTIAALAAGKHVLCEKPLARTLADGDAIATAAAKASTYFMPAMCMRFWPGWTWLKDACDDRRYGAVLSASFRRVASMPPGWYATGADSGGAALDLHIHDTDFITWLFGMPREVSSRGYSKTTGAIDHLVTAYHYDRGPLVVAEGGWSMADGFGFSMRYTVNFEHATADFDLARAKPLELSHGGTRAAVEIPPGDGYAGELRYFLDCVRAGRPPQTVTAAQALLSLRVCEAEVRSVLEGRAVGLV